MSDIVLRHARIFDGYAADLITGRQVRVRDGVIQGLEPDGLNLNGADVVDCQSKVLMPGLIDAHVHVYMAGPGESLGAQAPLSYRALQAANFLKHILSCGFTTVRDVGGADVGLAAALRNQLIEGPRLLYGAGLGVLHPTDDPCYVLSRIARIPDGRMSFEALFKF